MQKWLNVSDGESLRNVKRPRKRDQRGTGSNDRGSIVAVPVENASGRAQGSCGLSPVMSDLILATARLGLDSAKKNRQLKGGCLPHDHSSRQLRRRRRRAGTLQR